MGSQPCNHLFVSCGRGPNVGERRGGLRRTFNAGGRETRDMCRGKNRARKARGRESVRAAGRRVRQSGERMSGEARWRKGQREDWPGWQVVQGNEGARKRRQRDGKGAGGREAGEQESVGSWYEENGGQAGVLGCGDAGMLGGTMADRRGWRESDKAGTWVYVEARWGTVSG